MKERHIIAATCKNNAIGYEGNLIFKLPGDLKRFKSLTINNIVIMGRKTFESLGSKPLPNRTNIIVTSNFIEGVNTVKSLDEAFELAEILEGEKIYVIGGEKIYNEAIFKVDYLDITEINALPILCDTFFPKIDNDIWEISDASGFYHHENEPEYQFLTYKRKLTFFKNE